MPHPSGTSERSSAKISFEALVTRVQQCQRCAAMAGRRRVLSPLNGRAPSPVLLVGEAPGRLGAERTGIPFYGDASGRRFESLLAAASWTRADVFVTNAALCNPRDVAGRNRAPTAFELANCGDHLAATLDVVQPRVVVALGRRALRALLSLNDRHRLHLARDGSSSANDQFQARSTGAPCLTKPGELCRWVDERWLTWLAHPSPRTEAFRALRLQQTDWRYLRAQVDALNVGPGLPRETKPVSIAGAARLIPSIGAAQFSSNLGVLP